jgi:hypothetical protein
VVIICADGLSARAVEKSPGFQDILRHSAYTLRARTTEHTRSVEGWQASLLGGYDPGNNYTTGSSHPPLFEHVRAQMGSPILWFLGWYTALQRSVGDNLATYRLITMNESRVISAFVARLESEDDPDLAVLFFDSPDATGHKYGWDTEEYGAAVETLAARIKQLRDAYPVALFYIISDHGGRRKTHSYYRENLDAPDMRDVPWIRYGDPHPRGLCDIVRNDETVADVANSMNILPHPSWRMRAGWFPSTLNCTQSARPLVAAAASAASAYWPICAVFCYAVVYV